MGRVKVVTDSTADIPGQLASELGIAVVPCHIYFGDETYRDGVDLSPESFFKRLGASSALPRTTQPPVGYFVDAYRRLLDHRDGTSILSIHIASTLSGTVNAAWAAAQMLTDPSRVDIVDSGQISMGLGWAVIKAAEVANTGASLAEVKEAVRAVLPRLRVAAMVNSLDNLRRGGRISQVTAVLGSALQIRPLLSIRDGRVWVSERVRTRSRALVRLATQIREWGPLADMAILHAGSEELARSLAAMLEGQASQARLISCPAGAAITTHLGLGAVGVCAVVR